MAASGALEIFPQIQALVLDKLQVVSYKWLSRNFLVSSNNAKKLLEEFVEKHSNELEVIYTLSGWLKSDPQTYCVKLSSSPKLEVQTEVKRTFKDNCSVQVYSVQACIPNDLAVIWNAEFVQAEELFNRPSTEENCLRDNRFCGVSNLLVKRIFDGKHVDVAAPLPKNGMVETKSNCSMKGQPIQPPQHGLPEKSGARNVVQSTAVSSDKKDKLDLDAGSKFKMSSLVNESLSGGNSSKNKGQNDKAARGTGSIASLWSNASAKSKAASPENISNAPIAAADIATAEAQICAQEALDAASSEDEDHNKSFKQEKNSLSSRKRRIVLDFSDDDNEEENVVSLASPGLNEVKQASVSFPAIGRSLEISKSSPEEVKGDRLKDRQDNTEGKNSLMSLSADTRGSIAAGGISITEKTHNPIQEGSDNNGRDGIAGPSSSSPKRRKVLKTRIDDRGREVTEVVWEGEAAENDKTDNNITAAENDKAEKNITTSHTENRLSVPAKAQAPQTSAPTNPGGKGRNKKPGKGGPKDAKQGNILSFFKRA